MRARLSRLLRTALVAAGVGIAAALAVPAAAQVAAEEPVAAEAPGRLEVTQETLRAFAAATLALQDVQEQVRARLEGAETQEERARIREEAQREMSGVIERTPDISVSEYNAISEAARTDPALAAVVDAAILAALD
jgi:hypothetical protein